MIQRASKRVFASENMKNNESVMEKSKRLGKTDER